MGGCSIIIASLKSNDTTGIKYYVKFEKLIILDNNNNNIYISKKLKGNKHCNETSIQFLKTLLTIHENPYLLWF